MSAPNEYTTNYTGGNPLSNSAIIVIVIAGSGAAVLLAWAVSLLWTGNVNNDERIKAVEAEHEQAAYMREVRGRNVQLLADMYGGKRYVHHPGEGSYV